MQDELNAIDLNLLIALDALLAERSVTRAAARTGVGQSAMSSSLARLRRHFGDDLLVRAPDGMKPTPRALTLEEPLRDVLRAIRTLVSGGRDFDPATADRTFTIAVPDGSEVLLIPELLGRCCTEAPGLRIAVQPFERHRYAADLDADRLDLAIGFQMASLDHHRQRLLYRDRYVVVFNNSLLDLGVPLDISDYVRFPHVATSYAGTPGGAVDDALTSHGLTRTIVSRTSRFLMLPHLVQASPVFATTSSRLAALFARPWGLTVSPMPMKVPGFSINMVWHKSYDADPGHAWLRAALVRIVKEMT